MTSSVKARHRKAAPPLTPLSTAGPVARRGLAVAASSGLALTIIASSANAAGDGTDVGDSAGALTNAGVDTLANEAREAVTTNAAITTSETSRLEASDPVAEVTAEAPVFEQPAAQEPAPQQAPAAPSASGSIAATAMQYVGSPYVWGAEGPSAFDCSGLVSYVYGQFGTSLPHSSEGIRSVGTVISAAEAQPGDVIWWSGHVAIYAGDGMMVSAESESVGVQYLPVRPGGTFLRM